MRNTLILIGQIHSNQADGLDPYHAIIEATVQRSRPVILTALAAVLAFIPLTHSVFWGSMAYADRRHSRWHGFDACLPSRALRHLVPRELCGCRSF